MSKVHINTSDEPNTVKKNELPNTSRPQWLYFVDGAAMLVMGLLLFLGAWERLLAVGGVGEISRYYCYALAFYHGVPSLGPLLKGECSFISTASSGTFIQQLQSWHMPNFLVQLVKTQSPAIPFHALPHEYPFLTMVPFTLTLFSTTHYLLVFMCAMVLVAVAIYLLLTYTHASGAALVFALYLVLGNWATAIARFDLIPSALTLAVLLLAERSRWKWAFALLALAILMKFYALILIPPLIIGQQLQCRGYKWYALRRWSGVLTFVAVCVVVTAISLLLSVEGTLGPLQYFSNRPIQIETLGAAILWFGSFVGYHIQYAYTFGSLNAISGLSSKVSLLCALGFVGGLLLTYWLQLRGNINIATTFLLALLISLVTGKIFSPQYVMWVTPFVAYIGKAQWKWVGSWGLVCFLTTCIYPFMYTYAPDTLSVAKFPLFYPFVLLRGLTILAIIVALLYQALRKKKDTIVLQKEESESVSAEVRPGMV